MKTLLMVLSLFSFILFSIYGCSSKYFKEGSLNSANFDKERIYKVVAMPVKLSGILSSKQKKDALYTHFISSLMKIKNFEVVSRYDVENRLNIYGFGGGYVDETTAFQIAQEFGADLVAFCEVSKSGNLFTATVKIVDVNSHIEIYTGKGRGPEEELSIDLAMDFLKKSLK